MANQAAVSLVGADHGEFSQPDLDCDIVMKGGITSGVVYPGAVLALARRYRFRSIGGASAGGIAAAIVAAAEYARADGGFEKLEQVPVQLAGPGASGSGFMLQLFQADRSTRPLFAVLLSCLRSGPRGALAVLRWFPRFPLIALVIAAASVLATVLSAADAAFAMAGVLVAVATLVSGLMFDLVRAVGALAANNFGLCRLGPDAGSPPAPALTGWLHQQIQTTAGRRVNDAALTFADLWAGPGTSLPPAGQPDQRLTQLLTLSRHPGARAIDLQMMTTDLTHGRPMRLPVPYQQFRPILEEGGRLLFSESELRAFFPGEVVDHLVAHAPPLGEETATHLASRAATDPLHRPDLRRFPIGPDLPVLVATRMTLSFPMLISAIPLYELDYRQADPPLVRVLFSDGGITSNFPVHFFDSPLPTRPTFALNLTGFAPGEEPHPDDPCADVSAPPRVNEPAYPPVAYIDSIWGFLTAIKDAMQNWRDNAQAQLPGFRDRVIAIKLAQGEGGLNLTMDAQKIEGLNQRGVCAGDRLLALFAGDGVTKPQQWNDHRFVRYRTTMSLLERFLRSLTTNYVGPPDQVTIPYPERVALGTAPPYALSQRSLKVAQRTTSDYLDLVAGWNRAHETLDDQGVPRPPSTLRAVPPV